MLNIGGSTIGYDVNGMQSLINRVHIDAIEPACTAIRMNVSNVRHTVDTVWVGASAEAFKKKLDEDADTLVKTLHETGQMIKDQINNAGSNVEDYDQQIADMFNDGGSYIGNNGGHTPSGSGDGYPGKQEITDETGEGDNPPVNPPNPPVNPPVDPPNPPVDPPNPPVDPPQPPVTEKPELGDSGDVNHDQIDYSRIASNAGDADKGKFIDRDRVHDEYWGEDGTHLTYEKQANGTYLIKEDGTAMGFTDEEGLRKVIEDKQLVQKDVLDNMANQTTNAVTAVANGAANAANQVAQNITNNQNGPQPIAFQDSVMGVKENGGIVDIAQGAIAGAGPVVTTAKGSTSVVKGIVQTSPPPQVSLTEAKMKNELHQVTSGTISNGPVNSSTATAYGSASTGATTNAAVRNSVLGTNLQQNPNGSSGTSAFFNTLV